MLLKVSYYILEVEEIILFILAETVVQAVCLTLIQNQRANRLTEKT
jgi:hypothetical protein